MHASALRRQQHSLARSLAHLLTHQSISQSFIQQWNTLTLISFTSRAIQRMNSEERERKHSHSHSHVLYLSDSDFLTLSHHTLSYCMGSCAFLDSFSYSCCLLLPLGNLHLARLSQSLYSHKSRLLRSFTHQFPTADSYRLEVKVLSTGRISLIQTFAMTMYVIPRSLGVCEK